MRKREHADRRSDLLLDSEFFICIFFMGRNFGEVFSTVGVSRRWSDHLLCLDHTICHQIEKRKTQETEGAAIIKARRMGWRKLC